MPDLEASAATRLQLLEVDAESAPDAQGRPAHRATASVAVLAFEDLNASDAMCAFSAAFARR